jgi:hypothetical protein
MEANNAGVGRDLCQPDLLDLSVLRRRAAEAAMVSVQRGQVFQHPKGFLLRVRAVAHIASQFEAYDPRAPVSRR